VRSGENQQLVAYHCEGCGIGIMQFAMRFEI